METRLKQNISFHTINIILIKFNSLRFPPKRWQNYNSIVYEDVIKNCLKWYPNIVYAKFVLIMYFIGFSSFCLNYSLLVAKATQQHLVWHHLYMFVSLAMFSMLMPLVSK